MAAFNKARIIAAIAALSLLSAGCSVGKPAAQQSIDPPPAGTDGPSAAQDAGAGAGPEDTANTMQVTLYAKDPHGYVAPVSFRVPNDASVGKTTLQYMVDGGPGTALLPKGFTSLLPQGTKISLDINDAQKLATVDFSQEFNDYNAQDERKIVEAVTWALTGFSNVRQVQIRVGGENLTEMRVHNLPLDQPLTRAMGINVELPASVDVGQSTPVTVYFVNHTADHTPYFVPITRLVKRTDDVAAAALDELIRGPEAGEGLESAVASGAKLLAVKKSEDNSLVTVDFGDGFLNQNAQASEDALQAVALSLTENTGAAKVQVTVNGDAKATSKPIDLPAHINPLKL